MSEKDLQSMSFRDRALYELREEEKDKYSQVKPRKVDKKKKTYWALVQFSDESTKWYQLPKKLQRGLKEYRKIHPEDWDQLLKGDIIDVPVTINGQIATQPVRILRIKRSKRRAGIDDRILRDQFLRPEYTRFGIAKYDHMTDYLRQGSKNCSQQSMEKCLHKLVPPVKNKAYDFMRWLVIG
jgi:hypothetical protein